MINKTEQQKRSLLRMLGGFIMALLWAVFSCTLIVNAAEAKESVDGKVYEFDEGNDYKFSGALDCENSSFAATYGQFSISATKASLVSTGLKNDVVSYSTEEGGITVSYTYSDSLLSAPVDEWHLIEDKGKNVDVFKLDNQIQKGALILQRSIDHINWNNISIQTNVFANTPVQNAALYETLDVELINGCYYRLIVAYELSRKTDITKILGLISKDKYENKRVAEVYEFYAELDNNQIADSQVNINKFNLGKTIKVNDTESYFGEKEITKEDIHYGWDLGKFFVSGFTSLKEDGDNKIFLKNTGDVVTLWFNLEQNIDAINNDKSLFISSDPTGSDQYFQTPVTNFGRGMLIIRYTDNENVTHKPVMYKDYLEANTSLGADTRVQLFEEGDYEVALDYEVTNDLLVDKIGHYRIFFNFSVRNANCMVYPFDIKTGAELTNGAVTPNGFRLDLAKSKYLNLYIEKEIWTEGANGLTKDTRFNTTAKNGDEYKDEGIYTITADNRYTGLNATKEIYVGTNPILLAYMNSNYSIEEIQNLINKGAVIYEDGSIEMPPETHSVTHSFVSGTIGMLIPDEVKAVLPTDQAGLENGSVVFPGEVEEIEIATLDGTWFFQGWDDLSKVIDGSDQNFLGVWVFEKKEEAPSEEETAMLINEEMEPISVEKPVTDETIVKEPVSEFESPEQKTEPEELPTEELTEPTSSAIADIPATISEEDTFTDEKANGGRNPFVIIGIIAALGASAAVVIRKKKH